ncbi:MAG: alpha-hydroxy-acid oxidizing protein [Rhizobiales bacterium]|nr:alpha-hydroxy-acid oxidizing protein [Hyphomicrobiales bacterium]MBI3671989.1 alpha-hydroxy-acid oxidizing protein [Hyphomicrobiales bacterium]
MTESWRGRCYSIPAVRDEARRILPRPVFDFTDGGADDETTLRRNELDFQRVSLIPRPLNGPGQRDLSVDLLGHRLALPLLIGPTGLAGLMWPEGEKAAARAAAAAGTAYCLSHGSVCRLEDLPRIGAGPRWMQVFVYRDRGFTEELANRAAAAGYDGLLLTTDNQMLGNRERDVRNGFAIPPRFRAGDLLAMAGKLPWLWRMRNELPRISFGNYVRQGQPVDIGSLAKRMAELLDPSMSWRDVERLRQVWKGPLIIKGILHPDEARQAAAMGCDAVIVSNHGGRQLDGTLSSIAALPAVVDAVAGRIPVLLDGGIRRGTDVVKALALGAASCLIARPQLWGLAVAGEAGVAHVLEIFRREIDRAMALMGAARIADLTADLVTGDQRWMRSRP